MPIYIISDLHLTDSHQKVISAFEQFLSNITAKENSLYILGDFFDYWIGDNCASKSQLNIINMLNQASQAGLKLYFMPGNRDFLIGKLFEQKSGCKIISDPFNIKINNTSIRFMHGDLLCTEDKSYLIFRKVVRQPWLGKIFNRLPLILKKKIALKIRAKSIKKQENYAQVDVSLKGINMFSDQIQIIIHGHTHKLAVHKYPMLTRIVLGDWQENSKRRYIGNYIKISRESIGIYSIEPCKLLQLAYTFEK